MRSLGRCGRKRFKNGRSKDKAQAASKSHNEYFIELQKWMKRMTKSLCWKLYRNLQPCDFPNTGRGMRAARRFRSGDCIVSIPLGLLITMETVFDNIGQEMKRYHAEFSPQQALTILLAIESVNVGMSKWSAYINSLPRMYSTPLYFSTSEVNMLTGKARELAETLKARFRKACNEMILFVHEAFPILRNVVTEEVLRWAWSTVDTRSVFLESKPHDLLNLKPEESNVALAPFLDMLNHSDTAQITAGLNPSNNCYELVTETEYKKYDQVFISYGPHDNTKLLVNYGFTLPHNLNNCYTFSTEDIKTCFPGTISWDKKESLLQECNLHKSLVCTTDGPSWSLLTALKLIALSWEQLSFWKKLLQGISLCSENDITASNMAYTLVKEALFKSKRHEKFVKNHSPTPHQNLILNLAEDDVQILEKSLQIIAAQR